MDEFAYIVTRDSEESERDINEDCVALWHLDEPVIFDDRGYWNSDAGNQPEYEFTPAQFREEYSMDAPKPEGKFVMFTPCHWQRVEE